MPTATEYCRSTGRRFLFALRAALDADQAHGGALPPREVSIRSSGGIGCRLRDASDIIEVSTEFLFALRAALDADLTAIEELERLRVSIRSSGGIGCRRKRSRRFPLRWLLFLFALRAALDADCKQIVEAMGFSFLFALRAALDADLNELPACRDHGVSIRSSGGIGCRPCPTPVTLVATRPSFYSLFGRHWMPTLWFLTGACLGFLFALRAALDADVSTVKKPVPVSAKVSIRSSGGIGCRPGLLRLCMETSSFYSLFGRHWMPSCHRAGLSVGPLHVSIRSSGGIGCRRRVQAALPEGVRFLFALRAALDADWRYRLRIPRYRPEFLFALRAALDADCTHLDDSVRCRFYSLFGRHWMPTQVHGPTGGPPPQFLFALRAALDADLYADFGVGSSIHRFYSLFGRHWMPTGIVPASPTQPVEEFLFALRAALDADPTGRRRRSTAALRFYSLFGRHWMPTCTSSRPRGSRSSFYSLFGRHWMPTPPSRMARWFRI